MSNWNFASGEIASKRGVQEVTRYANHFWFYLKYCSSRVIEKAAKIVGRCNTNCQDPKENPIKYGEWHPLGRKVLPPPRKASEQIAH